MKHVVGKRILQDINIQAYTNNCTSLQHKDLLLKYYNSDMFRRFLVGHSKWVYNNIGITQIING